MASRLSEDHLRGVYDTGHQALSTSKPFAPGLVPAKVDLDGLLHQEDPMAAVQAVPPQALYHALVERGPEDALEVLELVSHEQLTRILDYDAWTEDQLAPLKLIRWLDLFKEIGPEQLFTRFRDLEEEYQVALLGPLIDIVDEEQYEKLLDTHQDEYHRLPCGTLFYKIKSREPRITGFVESLVEAALAGDVNYAYALLTHAAFMPPNESEADLARFRRARLEEDGFISYQESLRYFAPLDLSALRRKWELRGVPSKRPPQITLASFPQGTRLIDQVLASGAFLVRETEDLSRGFGVLANALCAATKIETDDSRGLRRLFSQGQALANLGLEWLSQGDIDGAVTILKSEAPQVLFRAGLSLVHQLTHAFAERLVAYGVVDGEKIAKNASLNRPGVILAALDQALLPVLAGSRVEILKGAFNRFPVRPIYLTVSGEKSRTDGSTLGHAHDATHLEFTPIDTLSALQGLAENLDGISGMLQVASLALNKSPIAAKSIDGLILRSLARAALGGCFEVSRFSDDEITKLSSIPKSNIAQVLADVLEGVEGTLRLALVPGNGTAEQPFWPVSRAAHVSVDDPMVEVLRELRVLKEQFMLAHEHGHLFELLQETLL
jgi:hypothetical protein